MRTNQVVNHSIGLPVDSDPAEDAGDAGCAGDIGCAGDPGVDEKAEAGSTSSVGRCFSTVAPAMPGQKVAQRAASKNRALASDPADTKPQTSHPCRSLANPDIPK